MADSEFDAAIQSIWDTGDEITEGLHFIGSVWTTDRAEKYSGLFAIRLNLRFRRNLTMQDLIDLAALQDTSDLTTCTLHNFYVTSVVVEATDADGQLHYIAVIATFAAGANHAQAAIRNAGFLSRFTGQPAHAVVAGMKMGDGFEAVVASGGFHYVSLDKRDYD